jgi:hypothetical protein
MERRRPPPAHLQRRCVAEYHSREGGEWQESKRNDLVTGADAVAGAESASASVTVNRHGTSHGFRAPSTDLQCQL